MPTAHEPVLVATAAAVKAMSVDLSQHTVISFDTEFIRESTFFPKLALIQVATHDQVWLLDTLAFKPGDRESLQPFFDILTRKDILKIVHAAQADQECLYTAYSMVSTPVLDTSLAASVCGYGDSVGLASLLQQALDVKIKKGHARTNWLARPIPSELLIYAAEDVRYLVTLGDKLLKQLESLGRREWALSLSAKWEDPSLYDPHPDTLAEKLAGSGRMDAKSYGVLRHLVGWRERRVRELDVPRRWVADDGTLVDLARVQPKTLDHLQSFRGLNKGEMRKSGPAILEAVRAGLAEPARPPRSDGRGLVPTGDESRTLELLKAYIGLLADRHEVALRHLATQNDLLQILKSGARTLDALRALEVLDPRSLDLIGQELIDFLNGKKSLGIRGSKIDIIDSIDSIEQK